MNESTINLGADVLSTTEGPETTPTPTSDAETATASSSELDPLRGKRSRDMDRPYYRGVLIAKRDGFSLATNSIGPLWILEVNQPGDKRHGDILRCFEYLGANIMIGNPDDGATNMWFHIEELTRPDGTPLEVATHITLSEPQIQ
ncbi:MAG: hypothetical protein NWR72_01935 [Bacteroidia bacterium]|nr:hypothetical protein [Bacteroidia bacterium]